MSLPHSPEAEEGILGGILLRNDVLALLAQLEVDDFYNPRHKAVFAAMRNLESALKPIDNVTLADELQRMDRLEAVGGEGLFGQLALRVPTPESVEFYAEIVKRHSVSRKAITTLADLVEEARKGLFEGADIIAETQQRLARIETGETERGKAIGRLVHDEFRAIERDLAARDAGEPVHVGVPTGLAPLDMHIGGLPLSLLTILAGRPGMGKTTLMQTIMRAAAELTPDTPLLYTYEDHSQSFAQRELASAAGVATQKLRSRSGFTREDFSRIGLRAQEVKARRPIVIEAHGMRVGELCRDVKRRRLKAKAEGKSVGGLVIVDYLQNIPLPQGRERTDEKMGAICHELVNLAGSERIAVLLGSQLNRGIENRDDKRPRLSDLREAGRAEELCKCALGLYRPAKYDPEADPAKLEVHVLKNHQGEADVAATVYWNLSTHDIRSTREEWRR